MKIGSFGEKKFKCPVIKRPAAGGEFYSLLQLQLSIDPRPERAILRMNPRYKTSSRRSLRAKREGVFLSQNKDCLAGRNSGIMEAERAGGFAGAKEERR